MIMYYQEAMSLLKEQGALAQQMQAIQERERGNEEAAQKWEHCTVLKDINLEDDLPTPMQMLARLQTPQGIEFAIKTGLPTHEMLYDCVGNYVQQGIVTYGKGFVLCDPRSRNEHNIFIAAGRGTEVKIILTEPMRTSPVFVALRGARIHIEARGFAVCRAMRDGESTITSNATENAVILQDL